jgi:hypothetical protein
VSGSPCRGGSGGSRATARARERGRPVKDFPARALCRAVLGTRALQGGANPQGTFPEHSDTGAPLTSHIHQHHEVAHIKPSNWTLEGRF